MWQRILRNGDRAPLGAGEPPAGSGSPRRAYYRVEAWVPVRVAPIAPEAVEAAVYDLSLPDPLAVPFTLEGPERTALLARLRRIEDKLDLLLSEAGIEAPRPLSGRDRRRVLFSGGGLSLEVDFDFTRGAPYRVELLLPAPYARVVRAIAESVGDSSEVPPGAARRLGLAFRHILPGERDAIVAYSYDLQRAVLRAKHHETASRT
ncbi:MAG: hypothetical protein R3F21_00355 [Myxococcota bacterium]